jgi:hypothetical protein
VRNAVAAYATKPSAGPIGPHRAGAFLIDYVPPDETRRSGRALRAWA